MTDPDNETDTPEHEIASDPAAEEPSSPPPPTPEQNEALQRARKAAHDKKPVEMVEALYESHLLDGLVRTTEDQWSALSFQDAEDVVAEAVDALYTKVASGGAVGGIVSFLRKVVQNKACDLHRVKKQHILMPPPDLELAINKTAAIEAVTDCGDAQPNGHPEPEPLDWEQRKRIALATARSLLPRLGQENVRRVMAYIFDAVEAGQEDISSPDIADALGLTSDTVRQARHRGFERLQRIAKEEKLVDKDFNLAALAGEDPAESGQED